MRRRHAYDDAPRDEAAADAPPPDRPLAARLRALEDRLLGPDHVRIDDKVEDGHGSAFSLLPHAARVHHKAIAAAATLEEKVAQARAALAHAEGELAAAVKRADETEADAANA